MKRTILAVIVATMSVSAFATTSGKVGSQQWANDIDGQVDALNSDVGKIVFQSMPAKLDKSVYDAGQKTQHQIDDRQDNDIKRQMQVNIDQDSRLDVLENAPKPKNGKDGKDGIDGINGVDGTNGKDGADGKDGRDGAKGDKGDAGPAGTNGTNGKDGLNGKDADIKLVNKNTADIKQQRVDFNTQAADVDQRIAQQKADQQKANKAIADKVDNHEDHISSLEQQSNSKFSQLDKRIDDVKKHASAGTASAFAQANIPQVMAGGEFGIGAGAGTYDGESAIAVGASYAPRDNVVVKATVSSDTMHNFGAGAGVMVSFR